MRIKRYISAFATALLIVTPAAVFAHDNEMHPGEPIMAMWQFEPEIVFGLLAASAVYIAGVRRGAAGKRWRQVLFFGGLLALALALLSPIEPLADHVFIMHQVEHMLLRTIGPMLIILSQPQALLLRGMPEWLRRGIVGPALGNSWLRRVFGFFANPAIAMILFVGVSWFWMVPRWHDIAILNEPIHYSWHVSLLVTGLFFFSAMFDPRPAPGSGFVY